MLHLVWMEGYTFDSRNSMLIWNGRDFEFTSSAHEQPRKFLWRGVGAHDLEKIVSWFTMVGQPSHYGAEGAEGDSFPL